MCLVIKGLRKANTPETGASSLKGNLSKYIKFTSTLSFMFSNHAINHAINHCAWSSRVLGNNLEPYKCKISLIIGKLMVRLQKYSNHYFDGNQSISQSINQSVMIIGACSNILRLLKYLTQPSK